jgi:hypothetical protein
MMTETGEIIGGITHEEFVDHDPSGFSSADLREKKKTGRPLGGKNKCAICHQIGHNAKGCKVVLKAKTFKGVRNTLIENLQSENEVRIHVISYVLIAFVYLVKGGDHEQSHFEMCESQLTPYSKYLSCYSFNYYRF